MDKDLLQIVQNEKVVLSTSDKKTSDSIMAIVSKLNAIMDPCEVKLNNGKIRTANVFTIKEKAIIRVHNADLYFHMQIGQKVILFLD